jgi:DNA modification methylase
MLITADARRLPLRDGCVQTCVTSPPYWGLRDYGNPDQIGLERTPEAYVASICEVFAEVWRVLKDDGTAWLNLGDSYAGGGRGGNPEDSPHRKQATNFGSVTGATKEKWPIPVGIKAKDLVGIPWRVAFALQAAGWYLRSDIIWAKPNPMPESVTDRPTKAHEYLFLLAKSERYYFDAEAIMEPATYAGTTGYMAGPKQAARVLTKDRGPTGNEAPGAPRWPVPESRNRRSVWTVQTKPYSGAHFATFPEKLIEPCILAGAPLGGLVLDPFIGSGTVGAVCERLGRRWVGTDLSYQPLSAARTAQAGLRWEEAI